MKVVVRGAEAADPDDASRPTPGALPPERLPCLTSGPPVPHHPPGSVAFPVRVPLPDRRARSPGEIMIPQADRPGTTGVPERTRASLTEYGERRLQQCLSQGFHLALVRFRPEPQSLEEDLQDVARRVGEVGELISTLPVVGERDDRIAFDLLVASPRLLSD